MIKRAFLALVGLLLFAEVYSQGVVERTVTGIDRVSTEADFYYRGTNIPVLDITYHEFSADGNTWRKGYVSGDCYVRFANTTNNSANPNGTGGGYHSTWWVFNFCEQTGGGSDTIYIVVGGDTIQVNDLTITIPAPETLTGSTTNYQDSVYHTHRIELYINDMLDVDADYIDGYVIKYNEVLNKWIAAPDLIGSGTGGSLRVTEEDNLPSVNGVTEIRVPNSHLINNGNGSVSLILSVSPQLGANDYWRAGIDTSTVEGTHSIVFDTPFSENDYTVVSLFGVYPNKIRQNFVYSNTTVNGFDVLGVMEAEVEIHYLAIRNVDSLLAVMAEMGKVLASPSDMVYGYLANKTDDTTITVTNNQLVVIKAPNADSLGHIPASGYLLDTEATLDIVAKNDSVTDVTISVGGIETPTVLLEYGVEPIYAEGTMYWDTINKTVSIQTGIGATTLQVGQESYMRVRNNTGVAIPNGSLVYITGALGDRPTVGLAMANAASTSQVIGMATMDIPDSEDGFITTRGVVNGVDMTGFSVGDPLYLSSTVAGGYTNVSPSIPNHIVKLGYVTRLTGGGAALIHLGVEQSNHVTVQELGVLGDAQIVGDIIVGTSSYTYWGDSTTDGSWRMGLSGSNFVIERRESGVWITKTTITP